MATSYSTNLALALPATGELSGTWGTTVNTNITNMLDEALGYQAYSATGGADTITIPDGTTGVARSIYIQLNGTGGGSVAVPTTKTKMYFVFNNTSSAITFKVTGQTGVSIPAAAKMALVSNGTDVIVAQNYFAALTLGSLTNSGLTTGQVVYTTTGGLETSSSALTFNGTNLGLGSVWTTNPMRATQPQYFQYGSASTVLTIAADGAATFQALRFSTNAGAPTISLGKGRGTYASPTAVASSDVLGQLTFQGYGGTTARTLAQINAYVETYTSDTDISAFLQFTTSPSGAATPTERMRIDGSGNVGIGGTANASAILDAQSTTKGVRMPNMTTVQKNAIASPAAGLMVFDTTLAKLCVYSGAAWQTVTSI